MSKLATSKPFRKAPLFWETRSLWALVLWPISMIFAILSKLRYLAYELGIFKSQQLPVPIIIVGNIRVGGTGKTPVVIDLAKQLSKAGYSVGIISRGYTLGAKKSNAQTQVVSAQSDPKICGDEPVLMASALEDLHIPVWIGQDRFNCGKALLLANPNCQIIICDDGLQHYKLKRSPAREGGRDIEMVVRDIRGDGNGFLLPAGPLRESRERSRDLTLDTSRSDLQQSHYLADAPIFHINSSLGQAYNLVYPHERRHLYEFKSHSILASAGLGYPDKFFNMLSQAGLTFARLPLPDHYDYTNNPFASPQNESYHAILITEKDAVKCKVLNDERLWVVPFSTKIPNELIDWIKAVINRPIK